MKRAIFVLIMGILFISQATKAQDTLKDFLKEHHPNAKKVEEGLFYQIEEKGDGAKPKEGEYLVVEFEGKRLDGTTFDKSEEEPFVFQLGYRQVIKGWDQALPLFSMGSKVKLFLAPEWAYHKVGAGKLVPPDTPVMFDLKILEVLDNNAYDKYMTALEEREKERYQRRIVEQFDADKKAIHEYCMDNKIKTKRSREGVSYAVTKKGKGAYPKKGDIVVVEYKGYLTNGEMFEESKGKKPFQFEVGTGRVIKGLDETIVSFNEGSEGKILVPSKLAYGPMEIDEEGIFIPAHSILIFDVKVLEVVSSRTETEVSTTESKSSKSKKKKKKK